jgi:hypothetical protein
MLAPGRMQAPVAPVTVVMYVAGVDQDSWNQWLRSAPAQKEERLGNAPPTAEAPPRKLTDPRAGG